MILGEHFLWTVFELYHFRENYFIFLKSSHYCDQNLKKIPGQMISFFVSISNTWFDVFPKVFLEV